MTVLDFNRRATGGSPATPIAGMAGRESGTGSRVRPEEAREPATTSISDLRAHRAADDGAPSGVTMLEAHAHGARGVRDGDERAERSGRLAVRAMLSRAQKRTGGDAA